MGLPCWLDASNFAAIWASISRADGRGERRGGRAAAGKASLNLTRLWSGDETAAVASDMMRLSFLVEGQANPASAVESTQTQNLLRTQINTLSVRGTAHEAQLRRADVVRARQALLSTCSFRAARAQARGNDARSRCWTTPASSRKRMPAKCSSCLRTSLESCPGDR